MTVCAPQETTSEHDSITTLNGDIADEILMKTLTVGEAEKQKQEIHDAVNAALYGGDKWFLLDLHWYKQWKKYITGVIAEKDCMNEHPGPIDNSPLFDLTNKVLREHLLAGVNYNVINEEGWNKLINFYCLAPDQEPIQRYAVEHGRYSKEVKVEVYLIELTLSTFKDIERKVTRSYSKVNTVAKVAKDMKEIFSIPEEEEVRVWSRFVTCTYELINKMDLSLQDSSLSSGQILILEQKENGEWPRQTRTRSISSSSGLALSTSTDEGTSATSPISSGGYGSYASNSFGQRSKSTSKPGLCGLSNLGNTCFMNSALQCLSNTRPLMKYFMSNTHKHELNPTNPLGMNGKIAEAYGDLIHQMWNGHNSFFTPRHFKMQVGRFSPQFSGYQQQDSQELLAFLLDGLHEDLNRVKQKPYVELQDDKGRPDKIVAGEAWHNHSLRNSSIIVDLFHGQFKSTVECPECTKKSVTFDPFCYLSLPLPIKKERNLSVKFVPLEPSKSPVKLKLSVPKVSCAPALRNAVAKLTGADPKKLVIYDVYDSKMHKRFSDTDVLSHITDRDDIYVYETAIDSSLQDNDELVVLPVYFREIRNQNSSSSYPTSKYSYSSSQLFGTPLLVTFPKQSISSIEMYQIIVRSMKRFVTLPPPPKDDEEVIQTSDLPPVVDAVVDEEMSDLSSDEKNPFTNGDDDDDECKIKQDCNEKEEVIEEQTGDTTPHPYYLFDIYEVNAQGTQNMKKIEYSEEPFTLSGNMYLAMDWYPVTKKKYYKHKLAQLCKDHDSLRQTPPAKKDIQLQDCLSLFLSKEKLGEEDPWYCPDCKEHRQAFKKFDLWTLPKILIIHLKRFSYNRYWRDKLDVLVNFPVQNLDLTDHVINEGHGRAVYDLHGVSNHYGGLGGGHYTAYGINCFDGQWHYFDDSSVSPAESSSVVSKAAYVLFYTRRDDPENEIMNTSELISEDVFASSDDEKMD